MAAALRGNECDEKTAFVQMGATHRHRCDGVLGEVRRFEHAERLIGQKSGADLDGIGHEA